MGASFYGELVIRTTMDTTGVSKGVATTNAQVATMGKTAAASQKTWSQSWAKAGLAMQNVGRTFTQYYSLPVAAGLGYAAYSAYKYQKAMIQVKELTGLTAKEASHFSDAIREASAEIGNTGGPQAAAEAYYFLASSGLTAQQAFDALKVSMKANVAGMGDIQVTADVVSSAMNAYRDSHLTAANAMDILMRTIEVGKAEPQALASSLGRIMPIANQLKVSLSELGGNVAALTLGGLSSAESVTALRGAMVALVSPAKMSIDRLKTLGLTYQEVTKSIADKGLLPTLKMLWDATDHNMLKMREIIPNVRATTGVMSLLGDSYEHNLEVIAKVNDSQGKLNETYRTASQTDVAKFNRAMNELKSTFIEVGAIVLPMITELVSAIGDLASGFKELPPWLQTTTVYALAATAALFPLISIFGSLARGAALLAAMRTGSAVAGAGQAAAAIGAQAAGAGGSAATAARFGAPLAKIAAFVPAAAISALIATAIVSGIKKAAETDGSAWDKIKAGLEEAFYMGHIFDKGGMFESVGQFVEDVKGSFKDLWLSPFTESTEGIDAFYGALQDAKERLKEYADSSTVAQMQTGYLADDLERMGDIGMEKIMPDFTLNASFKQVQEWRKNIMRELDVGKAEAQGILDLWFQPGRGWNVPVKAMKSVDGIRERIKGLREEANRRLSFDINDPSVKKIERTIDRLQVRMRRLRRQGGIEFKDVKPPKIDASGSMKKLKGDINQMEIWLGALVRARSIPIEIRRQKAKKAVEEIETQLNQVKARIQKSGITPELKAKKTKLENALREANTALDTFGKREETPVVGLEMTAFDAGILHVMSQLAAIPDAVNINVTTSESPIPPNAWGGIYRKPLVTLVGEEGPEVIIPLTKPARAAQLMAASGLSKYVEQRPVTSGVKPVQAAPVETGPRELHYHNHMSLPQGIVVSDVERFGRTVQPYVESGTMLAQRRRERGRAGL